MRYCQKCSLYKPPRAHHCRICNRCVLRMVCLTYISFMYYLDVLHIELKVFHFGYKDHHCVWMNNCVGHANYKIFFIFVMYAVVACIYSLVSLHFDTLCTVYCLWMLYLFFLKYVLSSIIAESVNSILVIMCIYG